MYSFPAEHYERLDDEVQSILADCDVSEFKWKKVRSAQYRFAALAIVDLVLDHVWQSDLRVDALIWDTYDSRHRLDNRDDRANFERMLHHVF